MGGVHRVVVGRRGKGVVSTLTKHGKMFPTDWEWKGEHWHIAR